MWRVYGRQVANKLWWTTTTPSVGSRTQYQPRQPLYQLELYNLVFESYSCPRICSTHLHFPAVAVFLTNHKPQGYGKGWFRQSFCYLCSSYPPTLEKAHELIPNYVQPRGWLLRLAGVGWFWILFFLLCDPVKTSFRHPYILSKTDETDTSHRLATDPLVSRTITKTVTMSDLRSDFDDNKATTEQSQGNVQSAATPVLSLKDLLGLENNGLDGQKQGEITALQILEHFLTTSKLTLADIEHARSQLARSACQQRPRHKQVTNTGGSPSTSRIPSSKVTVEANPAVGDRNVELKGSKVDEGSKNAKHNGKELGDYEEVDSIRRRHVALHLYYDGETYSGLAENVGRADDQSVERALFAALQKTHLIKTALDGEAIRRVVQYSRCGRTDRGVSAAGQVVALQLKSAFSPKASWDFQGHQLVKDDELPKNSVHTLSVFCPSRKKPTKTKKKNKTAASDGSNDMSNKSHKEQDPDPSSHTQRIINELAYDKMLNNVLPPDIRVLGWAPVSNDFSARFSATTRTYRYFFQKNSELSLARMQSALSLLEGEHDFRNFCKMDVEHVYNFVRRIDYARVYIATSKGDSSLYVPDRETSSNERDDSGSNLCYFEIKGQAFLWHQIRCIVSVLFLVGRSLEEPSIVTDLLNIQKYPGKPAYTLADERPLVLHHCGYPNLHMGSSVSNLWNLTCHFEQQCEDLVLATARIQNGMNQLQEALVFVEDFKKFCIARLTDRRKKASKWGKGDCAKNPVDLVDQRSLNNVIAIKWKQALTLMKSLGLVPYGTVSAKDTVHTPLHKRSMGTTLEEKIASAQLSSKRKSRFEENVVKKRKSKEVDQAFYEHMTRQGGSAF